MNNQDYIEANVREFEESVRAWLSFFTMEQRNEILEKLRTALTQADTNGYERGRQEGREAAIEKWRFADLVKAVKTMLTMAYPLDIFDGSSGDPGPRFTVKLHEAMAILDETSNAHRDGEV